MKAMKTTFIYKEIDNCEIKGDFYPVEEKNAPLIVYIHGGGLIWGTRTDINPDQIKLYQQAGYHVCSIDYRLAPESKLPDIYEDIQDMIIWLKETGQEKFGFDPDRIAVIGGSAGGYLALLSGTFNVRPKAIVSFYGYGDILGDWSRNPNPHYAKMQTVPAALVQQLIQNKTISESPIERRFALYLYGRQQGKWLDFLTDLNVEENAEKLYPFCPIKNIDANYPPTMLLHGDQDVDVPYEQSIIMSEALEKAGIDNTLHIIPNKPHVFDENMNDPLVIKAFDQVIAFLKKNL